MAKKHGVSEQTIYAWRKRFGTMTADETKQLKALEQDEGKKKLRNALIGGAVTVVPDADPAADAELVTLEGEADFLLDHLDGRPLVLFFGSFT